MRLVNLFKNLISNKEQTDEVVDSAEDNNLSTLEIVQETTPMFKSENVIFNKLDYLEQYIKIFSLAFPEEYKKYLGIIQKHKEDYHKELGEFQKGQNGNITFSIDPEYESQRYVQVITLEEEIKRFVEFEVDYKACKEKFCKLCYKLNLFYNRTINSDIERDIIINQLNNAYNSLETLVKDVKEREFFIKDSRKKDDILNYIIYSDYIIFKSFVRVGLICNFSEYKQEISKIYLAFDEEYYDNLVFKFFIENLEEIQNLISTNLDKDKMFEFVLKESQNLERKLEDYKESFNDYMFLESTLKLENTVYGLSQSYSLKFNLDISKMVEFTQSNKEFISVNNIAIAILSLIRNERAMLLEKIVDKFHDEISWREFYFLCKIFCLTTDVVNKSENTVFRMVKSKFAKISEKYAEYTDEYVLEEKKRILNYSGSKSKKYILLFDTITMKEINFVNVLNDLSLDFKVENDKVYLNHSYFNGFKNLEANFGQEIIF